MTSSVRPKLYNYADKNNEETDFITCPLLELINSKSRKPITKYVVNVYLNMKFIFLNCLNCLLVITLCLKGKLTFVHYTCF